MYLDIDRQGLILELGLELDQSLSYSPHSGQIERMLCSYLDGQVRSNIRVGAWVKPVIIIQSAFLIDRQKDHYVGIYIDGCIDRVQYQGGSLGQSSHYHTVCILEYRQIDHYVNMYLDIDRWGLVLELELGHQKHSKQVDRQIIIGVQIDNQSLAIG